MRGKSVVVLCLLSLASAPVAMAYEPLLHRKISQRALSAASAGNDFLPRMGVSDPKDIAELSAAVAQGAKDEDGKSPFILTFARPLNHFLDPVSHTALRVPNPLAIPPACHEVGTRADNWALHDILNEYRLDEIRRHYYRSLTGPRGERKGELVETFRGLGHLMHLVEDMGQPEHTRNDQHLYPGFDTRASIYEQWTADNLIAREFPGSSEFSGLSTEGFFENYPVVKLPNYAAYFSNSSGTGLADYSNAHFVTQDTNYDDELNPFKCQHYDDPSIELASPSTEFVLRKVLGGSVLVEVTSLSYPVFDRYTGSVSIDEHHSALSAIDFETGQLNPLFPRVYSLSDSSWLTRSALLVPRAVGYAAGILDHFFRGKIAVDWTLAADGSASAEIINLSDEPITNADLEIYYLDPTQDLYPVRFQYVSALAARGQPGDRMVVSGLQGPAGCILEYERRVILKGRLGNDDGEVLALVQPGLGSAGCQLPDPRCIDGVGCGTAGTLRVELVASRSTDDVTLAVYDDIDIFSMTYTCFEGCDGINTIPGATLERAVSPGALESVTIPVPPRDSHYQVYMIHDGHMGPQVVTVRLFVNGRLVREVAQESTELSVGTFAEPIWGAWYP